MTLGVTYDDNLVWIIFPPTVEALVNKSRVYFRTIDPPLNGMVIFWVRKMLVLEIVGND